MNRPTLRRLSIVALFLLAVTAISGGVWRYGYGQALDQLAQRGRSDLALATDRLTGQLQQYQQLAVLLSDHPMLREVLRGGATEAARARLLRAADKTAALNLFLVDAGGRVRVAANGGAPEVVADTGYFRRARHGALGEEHRHEETTGQRAYYFAAPIFAPSGRFAGALVVVANIDRIEEEWRGARPAIYFTDAAGEVFISNRSELLFWLRRADGQLVPRDGQPTAFEARRVGGHELWLTDWSNYVPHRGLHLQQDLPVINMRAEALIDVDPARRIAGLQAAVVAAVFLAFGALSYLATERRRTLARANALLETRVEARTAELRKAQDDLVQAGKLSALGQMSAGISHELNQPLMAIRQYAENGAAFLQRDDTDRAGENLTKIADMANRMARIIKNLRAFARNESEPVGRVELVQVINAAVELTASRLRADNVDLDWEPDQLGGPVYARGGEVRLTQVFVNLINNAADAMMDQVDRSVRIHVHTGAQLQVSVADIGPGIREPDKVFEPFYSTKAVGSGEGLGLGLSISYGLVQSFGGNIRGSNSGTGAVFTVELDYWTGEARHDP